MHKNLFMTLDGLALDPLRLCGGMKMMIEFYLGALIGACLMAVAMMMITIWRDK
jgi:hypothetical protein